MACCKSLLMTLLLLLTLTFGDAKGGGGRSGGSSFYSRNHGSSSFYSRNHGSSSYYSRNHGSSYYRGGGGRSGGGSSKGSLIALLVLIGIATVVLIGIAIIVLFIRLLVVWNRKDAKSSQHTKTKPLYYRTRTKNRRVDDEYYSEIARYCKKETAFPIDVMLPSSGAWKGTYIENGVTHSSRYDFTFDEGGNINGRTHDQDGFANIRGRFYYRTNGRINIVWLEDYGGGLKTLCRGAISVNNGSSIEGTFKATTGVTGPFECSPFGP